MKHRAFETLEMWGFEPQTPCLQSGNGSLQARQFPGFMAKNHPSASARVPESVVNRL